VVCSPEPVTVVVVVTQVSSPRSLTVQVVDVVVFAFAEAKKANSKNTQLIIKFFIYNTTPNNNSPPNTTKGLRMVPSPFFQNVD